MADVLPDQLRLMAGAYADEVAYTDVGADLDLTFGEWESRSNQLARWLIGQGVEKGDRVALAVTHQRLAQVQVGRVVDQQRAAAAQRQRASATRRIISLAR